MKKFLGLGRGLESLIPTKANVKITPKVQENIYYVEINKIRPNPNQPRKEIDSEGLKELAASIKKYGILQPLLVSKVEHETPRGIEVEYELIAGERRWRAALIANLPHVPAIIKSDFDENRLKLEVALVENLQRQNLDPIEEAEAFKRLAREFKLTQQEIAARIGKSREVIANAIRLLDLPVEAKEALRSGKISRTHARTLLAFPGENKQKEMLKEILAGDFAVRNLEEVARQHRRAQTAGEPAPPPNRFTDLEQNLTKSLAAPVLIRSGADGGRIIIKFSNLEDLNKIVKVILD